MPFLAPLIVGGLGLAGGAAIAAQIGIGLALSLGAGALSRVLMPKPKQRANSNPVDLSLDPNKPRMMIFGEALTAGSLEYAKNYGSKNKYELRVIALADHPCQGLLQIYVNGEAKGRNATTGYVTGFDNKLRVRFFDGSQTEAPAELVTAADGEWLSTDRFVNGTWALVEATFDAKLFPSGFPEVLFKVRGMKLYDPRKDGSIAGGVGAHRWDDQSTWTWSDNPVLAAYLIMRGYWVNGERLFGGRAPASVLPIDAWRAEANACDELVSLAAGGTEKRYRINGVMPSNAAPDDALNHVITAMAGKRIDSGGLFYVRAGVARSSVAHFTDDDIVRGTRRSISHKRPATALVNAVYATYRDPAQMFAEVDLPPRTSSSDEATDGGRYDASYDLAYVTSATQGQRVMEILRRQGRMQVTADVTLTPRFCALEAGDWITWTSARYGWTNKLFEVLSAPSERDLRVSLRLQEIAASVYDWTTADELTVTDPSDLAPATPPDGVLAGLALTSTTIVSPGGDDRPGLTLTWTPPDDDAISDIEIEYRQQGVSGSEMRVTAFEPEAGQYTWITGVQGAITYEARARVVSYPARDNAWSSWVVMAGATTLPVAPIALDVPPGSVPLDRLDDQAQHEISLITAVDEGLGSAPNNQALLEEYLATLGEAMGDLGNALMRYREELSTEANGARAEIVRESILRATELSALAALVESVSTTLNDSVATVQEILTSVDGIRAQAMTKIDINGRAVGWFSLDGMIDNSTFDVVADKFRFSLPDVNGGDPSPILGVGLVNGEPAMVLRGDFIADGGIAARSINVISLSSIVANIGEITAGVLRSADGEMIIDLDNKRIRAIA